VVRNLPRRSFAPCEGRIVVPGSTRPKPSNQSQEAYDAFPRRGSSERSSLFSLENRREGVASLMTQVLPETRIPGASWDGVLFDRFPGLLAP